MQIRFKQRRNYVIWGLLSIIFMLLGISIITLNPVDKILKHVLTFKEGSMFHEIFKAPPIDVYLNFYLFNITNADKFIKGEDKKIKLEEIGPYVYRESRTNENITFNENNTVTYSPKSVMTFLPEKSAGDPLVDIIISANLPYLGVMTVLSNQSVWRQIGAQTLLRSWGAQPILNLTVDEFMWGYQDKMIRLISGFLPSWMDFQKFGVMDRVLNADKTKFVTIDLSEDKSKKYKIQSWDGLGGIPEWGYSENKTNPSCNTLRGEYEGLMFPPRIEEGTPLHIYKRLLCRKLHLEYKYTMEMDNGLTGYRYEMPDDELYCSNKENSCFCKPGVKTPDGLSALDPCYYGLPLSISLPHFLKSDESLFERVDGLQPDKEKHSSHYILQPDIGMPMIISSRTQVNFVINNIKFSKDLRAFSDMVLPILWMDGVVDGFGEDLESKLVIGLKYAPIFQTYFAWIVIVFGALLFLYITVFLFLAKPKQSKKEKQIREPLKYIQVSVNEKIRKDSLIKNENMGHE